MRKKIAVGFLISIIIFIAGLYIFKTIEAKDKEKMVVIDYKNVKNKNDGSFKVEKYEGLKFVDWIDKNNILVLKKNFAAPNGQFWRDTYELNSYAFKTKEFEKINTEAKINSALNVSPDKKYVIYEEPEDVTNNTLDIHENMIDLEDGKILSLNNENKNYDLYYKWVDKNTIFSYDYWQKIWWIRDVNGKILKNGKLTHGSEPSWFLRNVICGDIKRFGDSLEGNIYILEGINIIIDKNYFQNFGDSLKCRVNSLDLKTDKQKKLFEANCSTQLSYKDGNIINMIVGANGQKLQFLSLNGEKKKELDLSDDLKNYISEFEISKDGKWIAYTTERANTKKIEKGQMPKRNSTVYLVNTDTNKISKVLEKYDSVKGFGNIKWRDDSKAFAIYYDDNEKDCLESYIVELN